MLLLRQVGSGALNAARVCQLSPVWWECHSLTEMRAGIQWISGWGSARGNGKANQGKIPDSVVWGIETQSGECFKIIL